MLPQSVRDIDHLTVGLPGNAKEDGTFGQHNGVTDPHVKHKRFKQLEKQIRRLAHKFTRYQMVEEEITSVFLEMARRGPLERAADPRDLIRAKMEANVYRKMKIETKKKSMRAEEELSDLAEELGYDLDE